MDLLKQCQQWFEQDEAQKVIDTLEAIPAEERTPELDSELAKACLPIDVKRLPGCDGHWSNV